MWGTFIWGNPEGATSYSKIEVVPHGKIHGSDDDN